MDKNSNFLVSLDFELFWGVQDAHFAPEYKDNIYGVHEAIPKLLELFKKHNIHASWATVGYNFAHDSCEATKYFPHESLLPTYGEKELSCYRLFKDTESLDKDKKLFFAPDLVELINNTDGQEIASHTFSHYYSEESGQTIAQFKADIEAAKSIASDKGIELTSIIMPRNQCNPEYIAELSNMGFTAFRDEENDWIHKKIKPYKLKKLFRLMDVYLPLTGQGGYIPKKENGIWNFTGSRMYKPYFKPLFFLEKLKLHRIKRQMLHAAKNGLTFHFWWHPHNIGVRTDFHLKQLEEIFSYYDKLRDKYGMESLNMREAVEKFEIRDKK